MLKYMILGKYVFVLNDSMIVECWLYLNMMKNILKKRDVKKWDKMFVFLLKKGFVYDII